jgi:hypothetical protein
MEPSVGPDLDGEAAGDQSGWSIAMSADGSVVAIGAPLNDGGGEGGTGFSGAGHVRAYAAVMHASPPALPPPLPPAPLGGYSPPPLPPPPFHVTVARYEQLGDDIDGEAVEDYSGYSVALSADGSVVAVGAPYNDGSGTTAGHVRVHDLVGTQWVQRGDDIDGEATGDRSGWSVALSADGIVVAIGATHNGGGGSEAGHVRVHAWDNTQWDQRGNDIDGEAVGDQSGISVALSADGTVVAIGARDNGGAGDWVGHARVHAWDGTQWGQRGDDLDGEAAWDESGCSVALSADGSVVAIGARNNDATGTNAGHVRVHARDGTQWHQVGEDLDGEASGDVSGPFSHMVGPIVYSIHQTAVVSTSFVLISLIANTKFGRYDEITWVRCKKIKALRGCCCASATTLPS